MAKDLDSVQLNIKEFCEKHDLSAPLEHRALDLVSEVGEVAKEILKMSDYGKKPIEINNDVRSEIGDVLFVLTIIANQLDVSLDEALAEVLQKYEKRLAKGGAGSENE
ncbi:MAG: MazG nucleotide pyrophosphohydrolase domain-containing protein [Candidatus Berkelbacteria bacterium]